MSDESLCSIAVMKRSSASSEIRRKPAGSSARLSAGGSGDDDTAWESVKPAKEPRSYDTRELLTDLSCIALNVASAVGVVVSNKVVFAIYGFRFGTLLTTIHFVATSIYLYAMGRLHLFRPQEIPLIKVLPLSLSFCGFVVLTNLSLQYNSVGFYQMAKVLTTTGVALIQYFFHGVRFRGSVIGSLAVTCVGVMIATFTDVTVNMRGTMVALLAVIVTSFYQVVRWLLRE